MVRQRIDLAQGDFATFASRQNDHRLCAKQVES